MKVIIVITYFERFFQLCKTLESIRSYSDCDIIVMDDHSEVPLSLEEHGVEVITTRKKRWDCVAAIPANRGLQRAIDKAADAVIIQGAECYHIGAIVEHVRNRLTEKNYLSYGCYSIDKEATFQSWNGVTLDRGAKSNGENGWYNHPSLRPNGYHWCSVATTKNWIKLNGFDERYSEGIAMGDENLIQRVKLLGLEVKIPAYPYVVHQWHYSGNYVDPHAPENLKKYKRNQDLLKGISGFRAMHTKTEDLALKQLV